MSKVAGVLSFGLIGLGILMGAVFLLMESVVIGVVYAGVVLLSMYLLLMNYCRKCPHSMNGTCHHGLPGRIAKKLPYKKTGKYTIIELFIVIVAILVMFVLPIIYLYSQTIIISIYIVLWLSGGLLLRLRVCPNCYNRWCVICPNRVK